MSLAHKRHREPNWITNQLPLCQARLWGIGGHLEGTDRACASAGETCRPAPLLSFAPFNLRLSTQRKRFSAQGTEGAPSRGATLFSYPFLSETRQWQPKLRGLKTSVPAAAEWAKAMVAKPHSEMVASAKKKEAVDASARVDLKNKARRL